MPINTINKLVKNVQGQRVLYLHKLGTSHKETFKRFTQKGSPYTLETYLNNGDLRIKTLINPDRNASPRDAITYAQYVRVLMFYGFIDYTDLDDYVDFSNLRIMMEKGDDVLFNVSTWTFEQISSNLKMISNNIEAQLKHTNADVVKNAESLLSSILIIKYFDDNSLELTNENLDKFCQDNNFILSGLDGLAETHTFITELKRFNKTPIPGHEKFYNDLAQKIIE